MSTITISAETKKQGAAIAKGLGVKSLFVNKGGEFFTEENRASLSVDHNKDQYTELTFTAEEKPNGKAELTAVETAEKNVIKDKSKYDNLVIALDKANDKTKVQPKVDAAKLELEVAAQALADAHAE